MVDKIFGIGWAKTGTTTLGKCFEILGYNHQPQRLDFVADLKTDDLSRILELADKKDTFEDWPWLLLFKELDRAFPGSRFVLTQRDSQKWVKSYSNMLNNHEVASEEVNEIRRILYGLPFPDVTENQLIARYQKHNSEVSTYFRDRPNDLLIVDWEQESEWGKLCEFLGKPVPEQSFPHANKGEYHKQPFIEKIKQSIKRRKKP